MGLRTAERAQEPEGARFDLVRGHFSAMVETRALLVWKEEGQAIFLA